MKDAFSRKASFRFLALMAITSCASSGGLRRGEWQPPPWPPGRFQLSVTVQYRMDTETSIRTERATYQAELNIHPDQSMEFQSSSGLCDRRTPEELEYERARGHRVFSCQEATFVLEPRAGTIGGEARVTVTEGFRTKGPCSRWEDTNTGGRKCVEYTWHVDYRKGGKTVPVRVLPGS